MWPKMQFKHGPELKRLLLKRRVSVPKFAVNEVSVNPQTLYAALRGEKISPQTYFNLNEAWERIRSLDSKAAG
jgi:hypothetical protein